MVLQLGGPMVFEAAPDEELRRAEERREDAAERARAEEHKGEHNLKRHRLRHRCAPHDHPSHGARELDEPYGLCVVNTGTHSHLYGSPHEAAA